MLRKAYLPGVGVTVIMKAVPPEWGLAIAPSAELTSAIIPNANNSCVKFLVAGNERSRRPDLINKFEYKHFNGETMYT